MNRKLKEVAKYQKSVQKQVRKQKLRDARRKSDPKNQGKKPRQKRISRHDWEDMDDLAEMGFDNYEKIMPLGDRERRQNLEKQAFQAGSNGNSKGEAEPQAASHPPKSETAVLALVVETTAGMCRVDLDGEIILCDLRGNVKDAETGYVNPVAVGDRVLVSKNGSERGVVEAVLPRRSVLTRPYSPDAGKVIADLAQIVAANVDQLLIVASWREPYIWPAMIDRYLITAQRNNIEAVVCINKIDLIEDQDEFAQTVQVYQNLGHRIILASTITGAGIDEVRDLLKDSTTVLAGLSGVGKSSILTAVQPNLDLKVGKVSEHGLFSGQGRHTTTQASLWKLEDSGIVIDTPGVRSFGIAGIQPSQLASWYPEMVVHIGKCQFSDCTHLHDPGCAVLDAVESGEISQLRYKNYTQLYEELSA